MGPFGADPGGTGPHDTDPHDTDPDALGPARRPRRLRNLLLGWLLAPALLLWSLSFAIGYQRTLTLANQAYDRTLLGSALAISDALTVSDGLVVADLRASSLDMLRTDAQDRIYYRVRDAAAGSFITGYEDLPAPPRPISDEPQFFEGQYKDEAVRLVAIRSRLLDGDQQRALTVEVAETMDARRALTRRLVTELAINMLLLLAAAALCIVFGVQRGLAPLRRLSKRVGHRAVSDLTPIPRDGVVREVAPLIDAVNLHARRHRDVSEAQARFVANASHQMKTPLTALRAQIDLALQQSDPAEQRAVLLRIQESERWMERMISQLLSLARSEAGATLRYDVVDLTAIARDTTFDRLGFARDHDIDLGFEGETSVPVHGQPTLIRELLTNLIDNAIAYTPAGGQVTVKVEVTTDAPAPAPRVEVVDDGPGIAASERDRAFERFHRGAATRTGAGSGLGLAIVKEICDQHGVQIALDDGPGGKGLRVVMTWPPVVTPSARSKSGSMTGPSSRPAPGSAIRPTR